MSEGAIESGACIEPQDRGQGGSASPLGDPVVGGDAADLRTLRRAVARGWPVTQEMRDSAIAWATKEVTEAQDPRVRAAAAKLLLEADKHNLKVVESLDKLERLDGGRATENIGVKLVDRDAWEGV